VGKVTYLFIENGIITSGRQVGEDIMDSNAGLFKNKLDLTLLVDQG
jgi:hypothetical protein